MFRGLGFGLGSSEENEKISEEKNGFRYAGLARVGPLGEQYATVGADRCAVGDSRG